MQRAEAYAALAAALESWRQWPLPLLLAHIGAPPRAETVTAGGEQFEVELQVRWAGPRRSAVQIVGTAYGPSHWRIEQLQESVRVALPRDTPENGGTATPP